MSKRNQSGLEDVSFTAGGGPDVTGRTRVYCILGNPVGHSMSPLMHNAAFRRLGVDAVYVPFEVSDLARAVAGLKALNVKGASVTVPFKEEVMPLIDEVDETARAIGAVNTLIFEGGRIRGTNTDWIGALRCLEAVMTVSGRTFVVLGAGGAARALVYAVVKRGGKAVVVNRSEEKGRTLADAFGATYVSPAGLGQLQGDCLVNTTPVGMHPREDVTPVEKEILGRYRAVVDVVYNPMKTRLLREAAEAGCGVASGFEMFVYQGVEQFEIWTNEKAPVDVMRQVVYERLMKR
jgi:shikimate dehydrogenase